jgi:hypothetical protein
MNSVRAAASNSGAYKYFVHVHNTTIYIYTVYIYIIYT